MLPCVVVFLLFQQPEKEKNNLLIDSTNFFNTLYDDVPHLGAIIITHATHSAGLHTSIEERCV